LVKRIFADCDYARRLWIAAGSIHSSDDIDRVFESVGMKRPISIKTADEAAEYLLKASAKIGCDDKVPSLYSLGLLYLRQGRYSDAVTALKERVRAVPTADGFQALAHAYDKLGEHELAEAMRSKAKSLTVE
jgi:uncharacterized protein HemY